MNFISIQNRVLLTALLIITLLAVGRLSYNNFDFTSFIVAGSDFVEASQSPIEIKTQHGPGYDGQFFYRYAFNPFDFKKTNFGITVDHPSYRMQRIGYPFLVWIFSIGGTPILIPLNLILINFFSFLGIFFFTKKIASFYNIISNKIYLPLFLFGIYMSFSRDLSEVLELFFFIGTIYYLFKSNYLMLCLFATLTLLTRETSLLVILPIFLLVGYTRLKIAFSALHLLYFILPFFVFSFWKWIIFINMPEIDFSDGYQKIGLPFVGIIDGFIYNFNFSDIKHIAEFLFWTSYLIWNIYLAVIVLKIIPYQSILQLSNENILHIIYLIWFLFATCITLTIYIDDWGFVRIFSLWNMIGFLILIISKKRIPVFFSTFSVFLLTLTIIRLIVRP